MKTIRVALASLLILAMMAPMALAGSFVDELTYSSTIVGAGSYANPSVTSETWDIDFPTAETLGTFTIDPNKLLYQAAAGTDDQARMDSSATILFKFFSSDTEYQKGKMDQLKVTNRCAFDVVVDMNIRPTDTNMRLEQGNTIASTDKYPTIMFQGKLKEGSSAYKTITAAGLNLSQRVNANMANFIVSVDGANDEGVMTTTYIAKDDVAETSWNSVKYEITGAANTNDDVVWNGDLVPPSLEITWYVRDEKTETVEIYIPDAVAQTVNYVMAADRTYAVPGDVVTVYVQPKYPDANSPQGYVVERGPSGVSTVVLDEYGSYTGSADDDKDKYVYFGNGVSSDNGMMAYTFNVPEKAKPGLYFGFTAKTNATLDTNNKITITTGPVIKKLTVTGTLSSATSP